MLWMFIGAFTVLLFPCVCGIFRLQMHRCPRCLNEYKEDSIFSSLDDTVLDMSIGEYFGCMVKRRSLIKAFVFILVSITAFILYESHNSTPTWMIE
jgi:hypothetical protein